MQSPSPDQRAEEVPQSSSAAPQGQRSLLQLKDHLAETAAQAKPKTRLSRVWCRLVYAKVWASASPGQLLQQMHEKAWPEGGRRETEREGEAPTERVPH